MGCEINLSIFKTCTFLRLKDRKLSKRVLLRFNEFFTCLKLLTCLFKLLKKNLEIQFNSSLPFHEFFSTSSDTCQFECQILH